MKEKVNKWIQKMKDESKERSFFEKSKRFKSDDLNLRIKFSYFRNAIKNGNKNTIQLLLNADESEYNKKAFASFLKYLESEHANVTILIMNVESSNAIANIKNKGYIERPFIDACYYKDM